MSRAADEFLSNTKMAAQQQVGDYGPFVYGHIATYDPKTHRVRLVLPSVRDEDDVPVLTGWMPLGSPAAGNGWGFQIAPMGGATVENPTGGELCSVQRVDRQIGVQVCASMVWNQVNVPPFTDLMPGEVGLMSQGGSSIRLKEDITINSTGKVVVNSTGDITLAAMGNLAITAVATTIGAMGGAVRKLVTDALVTAYNTHTHPGTNQPIPVIQQIGDDQLTTVVQVE